MLKEGGALVGAEQGLFRVDSEAQSISPIEGSALTDVTSLYPLQSGDWLAVGQSGVARVDAAGRLSTPVALAGSAAGLAIQPLPHGGVLFGTPKGLSVSARKMLATAWPDGYSSMADVSRSVADSCSTR